VIIIRQTNGCLSFQPISERKERERENIIFLQDKIWGERRSVARESLGRPRKANMSKNEPSKKRDKSGLSVNFSASDARLLRDLGFYSGSTRADAVLRKLTMRQLDKLKMMFVRIGAVDGSFFPASITTGIRNNDLESYSEAIHLLLLHQLPANRGRNTSIASEGIEPSVTGHTHKIK